MQNLYGLYCAAMQLLTWIFCHIGNADIQNAGQRCDEDIQKAIVLLCQRYTLSRYILPMDDWPPYCPEHYTPLTIIHHEGKHPENGAITVRQRLENARIYGSKTINFKDLFTPSETVMHLPYRILIEGAPGIGKTILSKEIAFQWAKRAILQNTLLLLLFMRDPQVKNISGIPSLVNYFFESHSLSSKITNWLVETDGHHLTILIDGYDEGNKNAFISDIINRNKLTNCGLIITSRPVASLHLHNVVDHTVEVLGFTVENQQDFIQNALQGHDDKIKELEECLQSNPSLNTLCYIPLNMSILLCLTRNGTSTLPKSQTTLCEKFIIMTIIHFLKKDNKVNTIVSFKDLPEPYYQAFKELAKFAFLALQNDRLVFTLPEITTIDWCSLGLLNSAKQFEPQNGCDYQSFHFLHFAFQEYMAAYHIASLPHEEQLKLLNNIFWNVKYFNTWILYVGLTDGGNFAFKHFLSGNSLQVISRFKSFWSNSAISDSILKDNIKCLHLLHCLREANHQLLPSVEKVFQDGIINLSHECLSHNDIHTLAVLLLRSPERKWKKIDLSHCNIDDQCCDVLCEMFYSQSITVETLDISYNDLLWESLCKLCAVLKSWQTKALVMSIDTLYDHKTAKVINACKSELLSSIKKGTNDTKLLITYVQEQNKIIVVYANEHDIRCNQFTNCNLHHTMDVLKSFTDVSEASQIDVVVYISNNSANEKLSMLPPGIDLEFRGSDLHSKGAYLLDRATTVEYHKTPFYTTADFLSAVICHDSLSNVSYLNTLPSTFSKHVRALLRTFKTLKIISIKNGNISAKSAEDIAVVLSNSNLLQEVYLGGNNLQKTGAISIAKALRCTKSLAILALENSNISDEASDDLAAVLSEYVNLQKLHLADNCFQVAGAIKIAKALKNVPEIFGIRNKNIPESELHEISSVFFSLATKTE